VNREALAQAVLPRDILEQHGYNEGETKYIEQAELAFEQRIK